MREPSAHLRECFVRKNGNDWTQAATSVEARAWDGRTASSMAAVIVRPLIRRPGPATCAAASGGVRAASYPEWPPGMEHHERGYMIHGCGFPIVTTVLRHAQVCRLAVRLGQPLDRLQSPGDTIVLYRSGHRWAED